MGVTLENVGLGDASIVNGIFSENSDYAEIYELFADFYNIPSGEMWDSIEPHFTFSVDSAAPYGHVVTFSLDWDANEGSGQTSFDVPIVAPFVVDNTAQDIPVFGTVTGSYENTHTSDGAYEIIEESLTNNGPKGISKLEHKWLINVTGGYRVIFFTKARRLSSGEDDFFKFSYSLDDIMYHDILTVFSEYDDLVSEDLPGDISGPIYIRVMDTDQTKGNKKLDAVYIDDMHIKSITTVANQPPIAYAGPDQTVVVNNAVTFDGSGSSDPDGSISAYNWDFGDGTTGDGAIVEHPYLNVGTYTATLTVADNEEATDTDEAIVTVTETSSNVMYISGIYMYFSTRTAGKNTFTKAIAAVTVVDGSDNPVEGATVYGQWSGATSDADSGITGSDGKVELESDEVKSPSSGTTFTFAVTDVILSGWTYEPGADNGNIQIQ